MRRYLRFTVAAVRGGTGTRWNVLGWKGPTEWEVVAVCPPNKVAEAIRETLDERSWRECTIPDARGLSRVQF